MWFAVGGPESQCFNYVLQLAVIHPNSQPQSLHILLASPISTFFLSLSLHLQFQIVDEFSIDQQGSNLIDVLPDSKLFNLLIVIFVDAAVLQHDQLGTADFNRPIILQHDRLGLRVSMG